MRAEITFYEFLWSTSYRLVGLSCYWVKTMKSFQRPFQIVTTCLLFGSIVLCAVNCSVLCSEFRSYWQWVNWLMKSSGIKVNKEGQTEHNLVAWKTVVKNCVKIIYHQIDVTPAFGSDTTQSKYLCFLPWTIASHMSSWWYRFSRRHPTPAGLSRDLVHHSCFNCHSPCDICGPASRVPPTRSWQSPPPPNQPLHQEVLQLQVPHKKRHSGRHK